MNVRVAHPRLRRWLIFCSVVSLLIGGGFSWYMLRKPPLDLADRALTDIPTDEYEQWMQELGYTD
jgi:hypothetical protein